MELQHFSHSHPLIFNEDQQDEGDGEEVFCSGCEEPISGPHYRCNNTACHFFLHKKCSELPLEIKQHSLHPEHPLFLLLDPPPDDQHYSHPHPLFLKEEQEEYNAEEVICFGCGQPISGPHYRCSCSNFFLHKRCSELPRTINHHLHPEHPLRLRRTPQSQSCNLCNKICKNFNYYCNQYSRSCSFMLDVKCAFPPCFSEVKISQGQHQFVCLLASITLKSSSFTCNFCGNDGYGSPLLCTLCQFIFHRHCASSPETINVRQHPHLLTYTYSPEEDESGKPHCGICQIQFNTGHGGYNCKECNFFAHVSCAEDFRCMTSVIKTRNNESVDSSITGTATAPEVEHFSHEHNLILIKEDGNDAKCAGCMLPISAPYYGCSPCNFVLHKACIELTRKFKDRILFSRVDSIADFFYCDLCRQYCNGFAYKLAFHHDCDRIYQVIDIRCAIKLSSGAISHKSHEHPLFLIEGKQRHPCNGCGSNLGYLFTCARCNFTLDLRCAGLPLEARHRYDEHSLLLTYSDPNDYQFFCDICEKERDPKLWFYRCEECIFDAHIECVLREYHPYVKLGNTRMYDYHGHPLALVEKIGDYNVDYPECHTCYELCDELALECSDPQCNFITHGQFCER